MDLLTEITEAPLQLAPKYVRFFAALIDFILLALGFYLFAYFFGETYETGNTVGVHLDGLPALGFFAYWFLLLPLLESFRGQTPGKMIFKIKTVKADGAKANLGNTVVRHLFDGIDCFLLVGLIIASTNKLNQRIGDLVAKTVVVKS